MRPSALLRLLLVVPLLTLLFDPRSGSAAGRVGRAPRVLGSSLAAPGPNDRLVMARAQEALSEIVTRVNRLLEGPVAEYGRTLREAGYTPFPPREPPRRERR